MLSDAHLEMLAASGITPEYAAARGYETVTELKRLAELNIPAKQRRLPGLLVPGHRKNGDVAGYQYRPDQPPPEGVKDIKYVSPVRQPNYIDIPVGFGALLDNRAIPLWITEGAKKADCAAMNGLMCVSINGVYGWRGTASDGNKVALGDWEDIPLNGREVVIAFDGDVARKKEVRAALSRLATFLASRGAIPRYLWLPDTDQKTGLDDYLMSHTVDELKALVSHDEPPRNGVAVQTAMPLTNIQPITETVDGTELFDDIAEYLAEYVVYPTEWARHAHALWIGHAWLLECWESSPRIAFLSPEPGSGKTRALEITEPLVPNPIHSVNVTSAYLFRKIAEDPRPTLLYDEIDAVFGPRAKENEDIRSLLNSGHRKGAVAGRCVIKGKVIETEELPSYCAVALAGLNDLPDTIATRSILVRMRKRSPVEPVRPWRVRIDLPGAQNIAARLHAWAAQNKERATDHWPDMPPGITDRNADIWEALLAVADLAGGHWPQTARCSAVAAVTDSRRMEPSLGIQLILDVSKFFEDKDVCSVVAAELCTYLKGIEEGPWSGYGLHQNGLTTRDLARLLKRYDIRSKNIRFYNGVFKGYTANQFVDACTRYAVQVPDEPVQDEVPQENDPVQQVRPIPPRAATSATTLQTENLLTKEDGRLICWKCGSSKEISDRLCPSCQADEDDDAD
jgi:Protein of unknown function (DUF3631)/Domain of unknown function (DUF3854)